MFDHFTFGAPAQTLYTKAEDREASPTDCSYPSPVSVTSPTFLDCMSPLDNIVNAFAQSSLRPEEQTPRWNMPSWNESLQVDENEAPQQSLWNDRLASPSFDDGEFSVAELSYVSTRRGMATVPLHLNTSPTILNTGSDEKPRSANMACRRARRQMDSKMMSCEKHVRDISALVENMIESNEQCNLVSSRPSPSASIARLTPPPSRHVSEELVLDTTEVPSYQQDEDEGFGEMEEDSTDLLDIHRFELEDEMTLRRASTPNGIRKSGGKYSIVKWRKSADIVGNGAGLTPSGRAKVRCVPRMRRRKCRSVPE
jgi:hypothetical protein